MKWKCSLNRKHDVSFLLEYDSCIISVFSYLFWGHAVGARDRKEAKGTPHHRTFRFSMFPPRTNHDFALLELPRDHHCPRWYEKGTNSTRGRGNPSRKLSRGEPGPQSAEVYKRGLAERKERETSHSKKGSPFELCSCGGPGTISAPKEEPQAKEGSARIFDDRKCPKPLPLTSRYSRHLDALLIYIH